MRTESAVVDNRAPAAIAKTFDAHEIRSEVTAPHFGSWLMMCKRPQGHGWSSAYWCRITAADGMLRVDGDFNSITFRGSLTTNDDPVDRVAWMGTHDDIDHYVTEKARSGTGRDACRVWDVDLALDQLRELHGEELARTAKALRPTFGSDESCWPEHELARVNAMQAGLDVTIDYMGRDGVQQILEAIYTSPYDMDMDNIRHIGQRPSHALALAHQAVRRLHAILVKRTEAT